MPEAGRETNSKYITSRIELSRQSIFKTRRMKMAAPVYVLMISRLPSRKP